MKKLLFLIPILAAAAAAQTITTNRVAAPLNYREVDGKLYDSDRSTLWQKFYVEPIETRTNGQLVWKLKEKRERLDGGDYHTSRGNFIGVNPNAIGSTIVTGYYHEREIFLRHCARLPIGQQIQIKAMEVGVTNGVDLWDVGLPHYISVIKTNSAAVAKK